MFVLKSTYDAAVAERDEALARLDRANERADIVSNSADTQARNDGHLITTLRAQLRDEQRDNVNLHPELATTFVRNKKGRLERHPSYEAGK